MKKNIKGAAVSLLIGALVLPASTAAAAENTENTNEKWFPISVSSVDDSHHLISDFSYVYDENGRVVESPVRLSDIVNEIVDAYDYWEEFKQIADVQGTYDRQYAYYPVGYHYVYNEDGTVNEYKNYISVEAIDSNPYAYPEYEDANSLIYHELGDILMYPEGRDVFYTVLTYSHDYLTSATEIDYVDQKLWDKLFEVARATGNEDVVQEKYEETLECDGIIDRQYKFYYLAYGGTTMEQWDSGFEENEPGKEYHLQFDEHNHTIRDEGSYYKYYNGYDEYGNLIYRVYYIEEENVSYSQPFSSSSIMGDYEMKTVERVRKIRQIDRYTYAYGDPAKYNSDPDSFQKSVCDKSLADIVNIVEGDTSFLDSCTTEAAYLEKAKAGNTKVPTWGDSYDDEESWDDEEDWDDEEYWDEEYADEEYSDEDEDWYDEEYEDDEDDESYGSAIDRIRNMTHY